MVSGLVAVSQRDLIVTDGAVAQLGSLVDQPGMRATVPGSGGDHAAIVFRYQGTSSVTAPLSSGQYRRQIGLKLRAQDPCNLVYVMWRMDPKPSIEASVKSNPGKATSAECGAEGYISLEAFPALPLIPGVLHELRAEIVGDMLTAYMDESLSYSWPLPPIASTLVGSAGIRSDDVKFDWLAMLV